MTDKELIQARLKNISQEDLNKLSDEQTAFIVHPLDECCFLRACPGSGKTEVVGIKAAYEIAAWDDKFSGMAILSFTKNAAKEIADRVSKYDGINSTKHPHFIGTIDSWLHGYILHPFGHIITGFKGKVGGDKSFTLIDNEKYDFLSQFQVVCKNKNENPYPIFVNEYYLNYKGKVERLNNDFSNFSPEQKAQLLSSKNNFLEKGLSTYQDAEYICFKLLNLNDEILEIFAKRFRVIIIDECQDLSQSQIRLFHLLKMKGVQLLFVGDVNQSIYDFRKVYVDKFEAFIKYHAITEMTLTINFRSNQQIVNVCQELEKKIQEIETIPLIVGKEPFKIQESTIIWEYEDLQELPTRFVSFLNANDISIDKSAILARSHKLLSKIRSNASGNFGKIELFANALNCWNIPNRTGKDMQNALDQLGKSICMLAYHAKGDHQNQYCPEGLASIAWRNFLYELTNNASEILLPFGKKTWSEWTNKLLKLFLECYWSKLPISGIEWDNPDKNKKSAKNDVKSPPGKADEKVIDTIKTNVSLKSDEIKITTIHKEKGKNYDAILLVSAEDK
jgi:DNA helicase-2/ATP-dependent DNA helicase PcrA